MREIILSPNDVVRFWSKVGVAGPDACWPWLASCTPDGYGQFQLNGRNERAHRISFFIEHGYLPLIGRHECDNPSCCNPAHILDGTLIDNVADMDSRGRRRVLMGEQNGMSKLTVDMVRDIRRRYAQGETPTVLAREFGVRRGAIGFVVNRQTWRHVA